MSLGLCACHNQNHRLELQPVSLSLPHDNNHNHHNCFVQGRKEHHQRSSLLAQSPQDNAQHDGEHSQPKNVYSTWWRHSCWHGIWARVHLFADGRDIGGAIGVDSDNFFVRFKVNGFSRYVVSFETCRHWDVSCLFLWKNAASYSYNKVRTWITVALACTQTFTKYISSPRQATAARKSMN